MKMPGVFLHWMFRAVEIEAAPKKTLESGIGSAARRVPSEAEQLAQYYAEALSQYRRSFSFGLVFASFGLLAAVVGAFIYPQADLPTTIGHFVASGGAESVATFFFIRANYAKRDINECLDRLRSDRDRDEARKLCESLPAGQTRNLLCIRLALHYANVSTGVRMPFNIGDRVVHKSDWKRRQMVVAGRSFKESPPSNKHNEYANIGAAPDGGYYCTWISGAKKGDGYFVEEELDLQQP